MTQKNWVIHRLGRQLHVYKWQQSADIDAEITIQHKISEYTMCSTTNAIVSVSSRHNHKITTTYN